MTTMIKAGQVVSFDEDQRILSMQVVPWGVDAQTERGYERFEKGCFAGLDPSHFVLRQRHQDPPTGRGVTLEETDEWLLMDFKVARTVTGDEQIALYRDGVERGVSIGFEDGEGDKTVVTQAEDGRKRFLHRGVKDNGMLEVSTTYIPAFADAAILQAFTERATVTEATTPAEVTTPQPNAMTMTPDEFQEFENRFKGKIEKLEEKLAAVLLGAPAPLEGGTAKLQRQVKLQIRQLADVITTGNEGVVPDAVVNDMLGKIDIGRPFLNGTRRLTTPAAGTRLVLPRITQRPIVGLQESEKEELASQATVIDTVDFPMLTVGGAADISMQLLKRSSPEFRQLWLDLLGQAYAQDSENRAVDALLAEAAVIEGGALDPAAPTFGGAFTNAATATGRTMAPNRIFLSTAAIAAFIDAVEPAGGGGRPLYPGIASISGVSGPGGSLPGGFNLTPIWVPELDDETPDIIVGPSDAFAWCEDGTYTLEADVPSKFGRDIGLAGMLWLAPLYPAAFTSYTLA